MELNFEKIKQMDSKAIYDLMAQDINDIYYLFKYLNISKEDYYNLVLKEIKNSKNIFNKEQNYSKFLKEKIKISLFNQVKKQLKDSVTSFEIINSFINQEFNKPLTIKDAINYFEKLDAFFKKYNFIPNTELLIELLNSNNNFTRTIEILFEYYKEATELYNYEKIFDNSLLILIIDAYCTLKKIDVEKIDNLSELENYNIGDSVKTYLKEIGEIPLLTIEQEKEIFSKINKGDYEAKKLFIESNLRFVISVAKKYLNMGLPFLDLIQEGNIGLIKAIDKYDIEKGYKFSTYAIYWIKQSIIRSIENKSKNIRIPTYMCEKISFLKKTISDLEVELKRYPTIDEIANEMNIPTSEVDKLYKIQNDTLSINNFVDNKNEIEFGDRIPTSEKTPEDIAIEKSLKYLIKKLFEDCNLKEIEIEILILRYGLFNNLPITLKQIGNKYNLTGERIRQIEKKAIMKIRKSKYIKDFAIYMQYPEKSLKNIDIFRESSSKNYFKKNNVTNDKENNKMAKLKTIYEYFKDYTREQIDKMLSKLTEEEKELILLRYGEDLDNPISKKLTKEQTDKFYGTLMPKMKRMLKNPNYKKRAKKENYVKTNLKIEEDNNKKIVLKNEQNNELLVKKEDLDNNINKNDCTKMLELLRTPTFTQMMNLLTPKEAIIISLKLGYVDRKYFSTEAIAKFLEIEEEEVRETIKKILLIYKENINELLDNIITMATQKDNKNKLLSMK